MDLQDGDSIPLLDRYYACKVSTADSVGSHSSDKVRISLTVVIPSTYEAHVRVLCAMAGIILLIGDYKVCSSPVCLASVV